MKLPPAMPMNTEFLNNLFAFRRRTAFSEIIGGRPIDQESRSAFPGSRIVVITDDDWDAPYDDDPTGARPSQAVISESLATGSNLGPEPPREKIPPPPRRNTAPSAPPCLMKPPVRALRAANSLTEN